MNKKYVLAAVCVLIFVFQACSNPQPTPISEPTKTATLSATSTSTPIPTLMPTSTPTPIPLAWTQINNGQGFQRDTVIAFATDKKDPNVIYVAMMNAGVYKTVDGGLSWQPAHHGLVSMQIESLLIDSQNPSLLYAGTMGGIFKTEDGGGNWSRIGNGTSLLMDMKNNSHLYTRDENDIYETTDQGNNWTTTYILKKDCPDTISSWAIHPTDGDTLFIGGGETCAGVYQSGDSGHSWTMIGMEDKPNLKPLFIGLDKQGNFSVYVGFDSEQTGMQRLASETGIYVSYDGGANWSDTSANNSSCNMLTSDLDNPFTVYCAGGELDVKRGKGLWQRIPDTGSKIYSAVHIDRPNGTERIITSAVDVSTDNPYVGIFISTDNGTSWAKRNIGLGSARSELKIEPMDSDSARIYLAAYYKGNSDNCALYSSQDSGKNWSAIKGKAYWCGPTFDAASVLYLTEWNSLQMSFDGGETWRWELGGRLIGNRMFLDTAILPLPSKNGSSESISANPYIEGLVYDIGDPIYYLTAGSGWQISSGSEALQDARLFYKDHGQTVYAIGRIHQAYSTDSGKIWQSCGEDVIASRSDSRLALDLQGSHLYLATPGNGVLVSTDNCGSWQASNNGLGNLFVNTVAIDPNNPDIVYAGTDDGAYVTYDGGATWGQVNGGLIGSTIVYSIAVDSESNVYAATPYGVFTLESK